MRGTTVFRHKVRGIRVEQKYGNLSLIEDFTSKSGFNGTSWYGPTKKLLVYSIELEDFEIAFPGDWIIEILPLDYRVMTEQELQENDLEIVD